MVMDGEKIMTSNTVPNIKKKYGFLEWVNDMLNQQYCGICKIYLHKAEYKRHIIKHHT